MARRVNTRFVLVMSISMGLVACVVVYYLVHKYLQRQDPAVVMAQADKLEAEGKGKLESSPDAALVNLKDAYFLEIRAAALTSRKHLSGADLLFLKASELCDLISRKARTQDDAVRFDQYRGDCLRWALAENPRNQKVSETYLDLQYQMAQLFPYLQSWASVDDVATKLIKNQDSAKPRLYRAEARMAKLGALIQAGDTTDASSDGKFVEVKDDLEKALQFDPQSGDAVAMTADLAWLKVLKNAQDRRQPVEDYLGRLTDSAASAPASAAKEPPKDSDADKLARVETRLKSITDPLRAYLQEHKAHAKVSVSLANLVIAQYSVRQRASKEKVDWNTVVDGNDPLVKEATDLLEQAFSADGSKTHVVEFLGNVYTRTGHAERTEELYKKIIAASPEAPDAYFRLANFYLNGDTRVVKDGLARTIGAFRDVVAHPTIGSGPEARRNAIIQQESIESVAWYNLERASQDDTTAEVRTACLKEAAEYTDKLRTSHSPEGTIDLLNGRALLVNRDFAQAVKLLRSAEAKLNGRQELTERLFRTEMMLAEANERQSQFGLALEALDKAMDIRRDNIQVVLRKGQVLLNLARYEDARILMAKYLGTQSGEVYDNENRLPPEFVRSAKAIIARAWTVKNPGELPTRDFRDPGVVLLVAVNELNAGDAEAALKDVLSVMEKPADLAPVQLSKAYELAIISNAQLKRLDEAKKLAADALVKFPKSTIFEAYKAKLDLPPDTDPLKASLAVIEAISDEYDKAVSYAAFYERQGKWDEEIAVLQKAMEQLKSPATPADRDKLDQLQERCFTTALTAAVNAEGAKREGYFNAALKIVGEAEKLNADGTGGQLYRGRLEMARTDGKSGLQYLQQAVAQNSEYAPGRFLLARAYYLLGEQALEQAATNPAMLSTADNYRNSALEEYRQVIRQAPNNIAARQDAVEILALKGGSPVGYPQRSINKQRALEQLGRKADASALKEAQEVTDAGLRIAPYDARLIRAREALSTDLAAAIATRVEIYQKNPEDRNNRLRLATLNLRLFKSPETNPDIRKAAITSALRIVEQDLKANPKDLNIALFMAELLVESDKSVDTVAKALALFEPYLTSDDKMVKYSALGGKGEFLQGLKVPAETVKALQDRKLISHNMLWEEAVDVLNEAIKVEPAEMDEAQRRLADLYFDLGKSGNNEKIAAAEKLYVQILDARKSKDNLESVERRIVEAELRLEKFKDASARLERLLKANPRDVQALILKGYSGLLQQQSQQALEDLNKVLAIDEGNPEALFHRALVYIQVGERDKAIQDLVQATKRSPDALLYHLVLAEQYAGKRQVEAAALEFQDMLKRNPEFTEARLQYADFLKNTLDLQMSMPLDSASDMAVAVRRLDPLNKLVELAVQEDTRLGQKLDKPMRWMYMYAYCLQVAGKEKDAQNVYEGVFQRAFYTDPSGELEKNRKVMFQFGPSETEIIDVYLGSLLKTKDFSKVVELATALVDMRKDALLKDPGYAVVYLRRAAANRGLNRSDAAAADVDAAFECGSAAEGPQGKLASFLSVLNQIISTASREGAPDMARAQLDTLVQRLQARIAKNPEDMLAHVGLIQTFVIMKKNDEALAAADSVKLPAEKTVRTILLRVRALVRYQARKYEPAKQDFDELLMISPNDYEALNNYAFMLADGMNRPAEAIKRAQEALSIVSKRAGSDEMASVSANIWDTLGWAKYLANDNDGALGALQKSLELQPTAAAYLHLGKAYVKARKTAEAQHNCEEGIKLAKIQGDSASLAELETMQKQLGMNR